VFFLGPKGCVGSCDAVDVILCSIVVANTVLAVFALKLIAERCLLTADSVNLTRASACPSLPRGIVRVALRAFCKFRVIERMYDIQRLEVSNRRFDVRSDIAFIQVQKRWRQEPRAQDGNFFPQSRHPFLAAGVCTGGFVNIVDVLDHIRGPLELLWTVILGLSTFNPAS